VYITNDMLNQVPGAITALARRGSLKVGIPGDPPIAVKLHQVAVRLQLLGDLMMKQDTLQNQSHETIRQGMSESMRDQRMSLQLAPVAFVDLTEPRATEGGSGRGSGGGGAGRGTARRGGGGGGGGSGEQGVDRGREGAEELVAKVLGMELLEPGVCVCVCVCVCLCLSVSLSLCMCV